MIAVRLEVYFQFIRRDDLVTVVAFRQAAVRGDLARGRDRVSDRLLDGFRSRATVSEDSELRVCSLGRTVWEVVTGSLLLPERQAAESTPGRPNVRVSVVIG